MYLSIENPYTFDAWLSENGMNQEDFEYDGSPQPMIEVFDENRDEIIESAKEGGYDGIIFRRDDDKMLVAFRPEQIKSATGNNGQFDPNNPDIRYSRRDDLNDRQKDALAKAGLPVDERTSIEKLKGLVREQWAKITEPFRENVKQRIFDKFHRMSAIEADLGIRAEDSAYISARLSTGLPSIMEAILQHGAPVWKDGVLSRKDGTVGLVDALKPVADHLDDWLGWMVGRRAAALKSRAARTCWKKTTSRHCCRWPLAAKRRSSRRRGTTSRSRPRS